MFTDVQQRCRALPRAGADGKSALRVAGLLLVCLHAMACANILGIDEPEARLDAAGGGSSEAGAAGAGETIDAPPRPSPKLLNDQPYADLGSSNIRINGPLSVSGCPNAATQIKLTASGGEGLYRWQMDPAVPGFELKATGTHQEQAVLTGSVGTKPRKLSVRATDKNGATNTISTAIEVSGLPVIEAPTLPSICPDELYAFDFHASGGDEQHYTWSSDDLPATSGLALTPDGHLAGKFAGVPTGPAQLKFTVQVSDGSTCAAAPVKVSLAVNGVGATCPAIGIIRQLQSRPLPPLCLGGEYNEQLTVSGGEAPYTWTHNTLPSGLSLDSNGKLSGTYFSSAPKPLPPAAFAIQVTDHQGRRIERSELVPVREKCWFAYVAHSETATQLNFFDPLLDNHKIPPQAATADVVMDFKFSPNGRFVAYRLISPAGSARLSVIDLSTWQQNVPVFPGVTQYAWSSDSNTIAVAYSTSTDTVLSGLAMANPLAGPSQGSAIVYPPLTSVVTPINSELAWFGPGPEQLAMIAHVGGLSLLKTFGLASGTGFVSPVLQTENLPLQTWLDPVRNGVFAVHPIFETIFYPSDGSFPAFHDDVVIAPSGEYVARADAGSLNVFRPIDDSLDTPPFSKPGCDTIASWAAGKERIACAHQTTNSNGEVTFFDLAVGADPNTIELNAITTATTPVPISTRRRRLFSPSGLLLAVTTDQAATIMNLSKLKAVTADNNVSTVPSTSTGAAFGELVFAPNEKLLLQHRGNRLSFFDLSDPSSPEVTISNALAPSLECSEDFRSIRDAAGGWCGAERPGVPFWWSPSSELAAFQNADGTLHVYQFNNQTPFQVDDQCGQGCVVPGQIGFQP